MEQCIYIQPEALERANLQPIREIVEAGMRVIFFFVPVTFSFFFCPTYIESFFLLSRILAFACISAGAADGRSRLAVRRTAVAFAHCCFFIEKPP